MLQKQKIDRDHQHSRQLLRTHIQDQMNNSQNNLQNIRSKRQSSRSSRQSMRQTTLSKIKSMEKTLFQDSYKKSEMERTKAEHYFAEEQRKKTTSCHFSTKKNHEDIENIQESTRYKPSPKLSFFFTDAKPQKNTNFSQSKVIKRTLPGISRASNKQLLNKTTIKQQLIKSKDHKHLSQYIQKLQHINSARKRIQEQTNKLIQLKPKEIKVKKIDPHLISSQFHNHSISATRSAIQNKKSFSQMYSKNLQEKMNKKNSIKQSSIKDGNQLLQKDLKLNQKYKMNKFLKETIYEVQRQMKFKYMEKIKEKR